MSSESKCELKSKKNDNRTHSNMRVDYDTDK